MTPVTVGRLFSAVTVAEAALDAAKDHAAHLRSTAQRSLAMQLALLTGALALAFGAMTIVTRRVIKPLHNMRDAMLKVAAGDLHVDTGYARVTTKSARWPRRWRRQAAGRRQVPDRGAGARAQRRRHGAAAGNRGSVGEFEGMVRQTLNQLGDASGQMRTTWAGL